MVRRFSIVAAAVLVFGLWHFIPALMPVRDFSRLHKVWVAEVDRAIVSTPVIAGGALVSSTLGGEVHGVSVADGRHIWSLQIPDTVYSLSRDGNGAVYASTGYHTSVKAYLAAIDPAKGALLWRREFKGHVEEPVTVDEARHRLWAGAGPGSLWSLDTRDGAVLWHRDIGHFDSKPLLRDNVLYAPAREEGEDAQTFLYALRAEEGETLWRLAQPGQPWGSPQLDRTGGVILTTTGQGQLGLDKPADKGWAHAVSIDGRALWQADLPNMVLTPNVYLPQADLMIYVTKDGSVTAIRTADGSLAWKEKPASWFGAPGALVSHGGKPLLAVTSGDGVFYLLDALSGRVQYRRSMGKSSQSAPVVHEGFIYVTAGQTITSFKVGK